MVVHPWIRCGTATALAVLLCTSYSGQAVSQCINKIQSVLKDTSGVTFTVSETACDSVGNDAAVTISASTGDGLKKAVLIKYGPDERSSPPKIEVRGGATVVISIDSVAELFNQERRFGSYEIVYNIGHVEFPHPGRDITGSQT